jgi:predicted phage terminase large subunit-like protein
MRKQTITEKKFDLEIEELRELIRESVSPFEQDTAAKKIVRINRGRKDKDFFNRTYLPHYFYKSSARFHLELDDLIEQPLAAIAAPRGHAKSTRVSLGDNLHDICYSRIHFLIQGSDTTTQAEDFTTAIKLELEENPRIKHDFGELIPKRQIGINYHDFITTNGIRVLARGRGSRIRGFKNKQYRPDKFVGDDIENDENVENLEQRKKTMKWILRAARGGLEPEASRMFIIGTILHYDSALAQLTDPKKNEMWTKRKYKAIQTDGSVLWPERWSKEHLEREKKIMGSIAFNQEFQNDPIDPETQIFREEWIKYYDPSTIDISDFDIYTATDPSVAKTQQSDYQAIVTVGIPRAGEKKGTIYVLDADIGRTSAKKLAMKIFAKFERYKCITHGFEDTAFQEVMKQWIDDLSKENRIYLPTVGISQKKDKVQRITRLSPLVENGTILFQREQVLLIEQIIHFPKADHDDGPDALEMAVDLARAYGGPIEYETVLKRVFAEARGAY